MNTIKPLAAISAALFSASSLGHSGLELAPDTLVTGLMHPLTGLDHVFTLLVLGGVISLLYKGERRRLKRTLAGTAILSILLSWSFLHYSGIDFATYSLGFASSSALLMAAGARVAGFRQRLKTARSQGGYK